MSETSARPVNMGLHLFPPPPKQARNPSVRNNAVAHENSPQSVVERSGSPALQSEERTTAPDGRQSAMGGQSPPYDGRQTPQTERSRAIPPPITVPLPVYAGADLPTRSHTSFSEAPTLVRSNSNSSHSSRHTPYASPRHREEPVMRSIFPRYNPDVPLEHQPYFPTQASPTNIPNINVNRRPYSPSINDEPDRMTLGLQSPPAFGVSPGHFPRTVRDDPLMEPSSNDEMKELWKVTNGWRVSPSEGRPFCFKMTSSPEEPVHTLSSATQPFYTLRLIPTSVSAQMTMLRHDPSKPVKESPRFGSSKNTGMEVMATSLEEAARRLPPNDGLVALLYPRAASNMVVELANKPSRGNEEAMQEAAERECGRLVWDEDSKRHYLVHPAVATPFCVSINSSPAWSKVEYILEHPELPRNIVRLVRDGAGGGFLEVDTAVAAKIDCYYIVDVAICAIMLVALADEKTRSLEIFHAPPSLSTSPKSVSSKKWKRDSKRGKDVRIEEFELDDLESQTTMKEKKEKEKEKEKIPGFFGMIWMLLKCLVWTLTISCKGLAKIIVFLCRCMTRSK